jgi:hypothetical protein
MIAVVAHIIMILLGIINSIIDTQVVTVKVCGVDGVVVWWYHGLLFRVDRRNGARAPLPMAPGSARRRRGTRGARPMPDNDHLRRRRRRYTSSTSIISTESTSSTATSSTSDHVRVVVAVGGGHVVVIVVIPHHRGCIMSVSPVVPRTHVPHIVGVHILVLIAD